MRIPGVLVERIAKVLGLVSISSTLTEAYDQISRGIIDGMFQNYTTVIDFNLARFMPNLFVLPGGFSASSQFMVVNERSWQRISEADRAAIDALSGEALVKRFSGIWQKNNMAAFDRLSAEGIKVHRIEGEQLEAMKTKLAVIEQQWLSEAKGVEAQEALNFYRAELDRVAAELGVPKD
jgi:TRAP-type C4-dicarboxylate transport system substrate-binding protein